MFESVTHAYIYKQIENDLNLAIQYSQWGIHKNLWKEIDQYVEILFFVALGDYYIVVLHFDDSG
jgi:hypothetical protein